jgi:8-oxo-dGTP pyrophosphatase MutT (NUDIX family)
MTDTCRLLEADRLDGRLVEHRLSLPPAQEREAEAVWRDHKAQMPWLYDGRILLARRVELVIDAAGDRRLEAEYFEAAYSRFFAWKKLGQPEDWGVYNCFSTPALRSTDGAFLAGEMGLAHSTPGRIYFPCGTPDHDDIVGGQVDLVGCLIRELAEETGILVDERSFAPGWRIVFHKRQAACVRIVDLPGDASSQIETALRYIRSQQNPELAGMRAFRRRADLAEPRLPEFMKAFLQSVLAD